MFDEDMCLIDEVSQILADGLTFNIQVNIVEKNFCITMNTYIYLHLHLIYACGWYANCTMTSYDLRWGCVGLYTNAAQSVLQFSTAVVPQSFLSTASQPLHCCAYVAVNCYGTGIGYKC